ncbi:MAG: hypothetical protein SFV81_08650 [Pirellulaceae bacterium]|nr:hypothetical protein [Pirellulaceae bacterium]
MRSAKYAWPSRNIADGSPIVMLRPQQRTIHGWLNPSATFHKATRVSWKQKHPLGKPPVFSDFAPAASRQRDQRRASTQSSPAAVSEFRRLTLRIVRFRTNWRRCDERRRGLMRLAKYASPSRNIPDG